MELVVVSVITVAAFVVLIGLYFFTKNEKTVIKQPKVEEIPHKEPARKEVSPEVATVIKPDIEVLPTEPDSTSEDMMQADILSDTDELPSGETVPVHDISEIPPVKQVEKVKKAPKTKTPKRKKSQAAKVIKKPKIMIALGDLVTVQFANGNIFDFKMEKNHEGKNTDATKAFMGKYVDDNVIYHNLRCRIIQVRKLQSITISNVKNLHERIRCHDHEAECELGKRYLNGMFGVKRDEKLAFKYFKKAVQYPNPSVEAQFMIGQCYYYGFGVKLCEEKATIWYQRAAALNHAGAQYMLKRCPQYSPQGAPAKMAASEEPINISSSQCSINEINPQAIHEPNPQILCELGKKYLNGIGVTLDEQEAYKLFEMSAQQHLSEAQYMLGQCYYNGYGVERDDLKAMSWFSKAVEQGHPGAEYMLLRCH